MSRTEVTTYACDACGRDLGTATPAAMTLQLPAPNDAVKLFNFDICPDCLNAVVAAVSLPIT